MDFRYHQAAADQLYLLHRQFDPCIIRPLIGQLLQRLGRLSEQIEAGRTTGAFEPVGQLGQPFVVVEGNCLPHRPEFFL